MRHSYRYFSLPWNRLIRGCHVGLPEDSHAEHRGIPLAHHLSLLKRAFYSPRDFSLYKVSLINGDYCNVFGVLNVFGVWRL